MKTKHKVYALFFMFAMVASGLSGLNNFFASPALASSTSPTSMNIVPYTEYSNGWTKVGSGVSTAAPNDGAISYYPYTYPAGSAGYYVGVFQAPASFTSDDAAYQAVLTVRWYNYGGEKVSIDMDIDGAWKHTAINNVQPSDVPPQYSTKTFTFDNIHWTQSTLNNLRVKIYNTVFTGNTVGVDFLQFTLSYEQDQNVQSNTESLNSWVHSGSGSGSSVSVQGDNFFAYHAWSDSNSGNYLEADFAGSPGLANLHGYSVSFVYLVVTIYGYGTTPAYFSMYLNGVWQNLGYNPVDPAGPPFITYIFPLSSESPWFTLNSISNFKVRVNAASGNTIGVDYIGLKVSVRPQFILQNGLYNTKTNIFYQPSNDNFMTSFNAYTNNVLNSGGDFDQTKSLPLVFGFQAQINPALQSSYSDWFGNYYWSSYYINQVNIKIQIQKPDGSYISGSDLTGNGAATFATTDYSEQQANYDQFMNTLFTKALEAVIENSGIPGAGVISSVVDYVSGTVQSGTSFSHDSVSDGIVISFSVGQSIFGTDLSQASFKINLLPIIPKIMGSYNVITSYSVSTRLQNCVIPSGGISSCTYQSGFSFSYTNYFNLFETVN